MFRLIGKIRNQEDGIGIVTALAISFIVFALGATWYSLAVHELDEVSYDRNRTQSLNVAEAGAKEAMAWLAKDINGWRTTASGAAGFASSGGSVGNPCDVQTLLSVGELQGEYWAAATHLGGNKYQIESWGWAPSRAAARTVSKKVTLEVELIPQGGFRDALFAAGGGLVGGNFKQIFGTAYSGASVDISAFTEILQNDPPYDGIGSLSVYGDLTIPVGSNLHVDGDVDVEGNIQSNAASVTMVQDVNIRGNPSVTAFGDSFFKKADIGGEVRTSPDTSIDPTSNIGGVIPTPDVDLEPVKSISLPTFVFAGGDYPGYTVTPYANLADFRSVYFNSNKMSLSGVHHVLSGDGSDINFKQAEFSDNFVLVVDGSFGVRGTAKGGSTPTGDPVTAIIVMEDPAGDLNLGLNFQSVPGEVHHLMFSNGRLVSSAQTVIYGSVYGFEDATSNRLEIHFRPPAESLTDGFEFDPTIADSYIPQPGEWRDLPPNEPYGVINYCNP